MTRQGLILSVMLVSLCVFSHTRLYQQNKNVASDESVLFELLVDLGLQL